VRSDAISLVKWLLSLYDPTVLRRLFPVVFLLKKTVLYRTYTSFVGY